MVVDDVGNCTVRVIRYRQLSGMLLWVETDGDFVVTFVIVVNSLTIWMWIGLKLEILIIVRLFDDPIHVRRRVITPDPSASRFRRNGGRHTHS
jgi:hypothetical protein